MTLNPSNSSNLDQLALKGLNNTRECGVVMFFATCVRVSVCLGFIFESLDLETSSLVCMYLFRIPRSRSQAQKVKQA